MAFVIVEKSDAEHVGKRFPVAERPVIIGRQTPEYMPDIIVGDDYVSRRHAEITFLEGRFLVRDLGSTNGTTLDGQQLDPERHYPLRHDSVIGLGISAGGARVLLRFKVSPTVSTTRLRVGQEKPVSPGWLRVDEVAGEVWVDEKRMVLSRKEYDLIVFLHDRAGKICTRDELVNRVWPEVIDPGGVSDAAIDQLVHRLRLKIEPSPENPTRLINRKGFGYLLA